VLFLLVTSLVVPESSGLSSPDRDSWESTPPEDPVSPLDITDELSKSNRLQRDCIQLSIEGGDPPLDDQTGIGGGDPPSDGNTPERGGGDTPLDGNTPERTHSNQNNHLGVVITPCRDQPDAGLDLPIHWESPEAAKLFSLIIRTEMMSLME
jgi:hypothetical protein